MKKSLIRFMALLLAALPVLGVYAGMSDAATSRVAVIKSLTGTVQVKKSGGSKQLKAFAKMSLNEGDVLTTGVNSTAVLQFSNGTSEDDKMTVSAKTTLTFSKLSDRSGTRTKVSMFNGNAWVDVKSIASKNDEFTLETPTAIMGVRGTHLLVSVDPVSGATKLTVAAGVVNTQPTGSGNPQDVKPGDNALITKDQKDKGEITVAPADLGLLISQSDASIVEAIVAAAGEITLENEKKLEEYFEGEQGQDPNDLNRQKSNVENLLGAIVDSAVKSGLISQERVNQLVAAASSATGAKIDLSKKTITLTEEQKKAQEDQKKKDEEAKKLAEERKKAEEAERKKNEELNKKLEDERKRKEEENKKAKEEKAKKARDAYEQQLPEAEKLRFKDAEEKRKKEEAAATSTPSSTASSTATSTSTSTSTSGNGSWPTPINEKTQLKTLRFEYYDYLAEEVKSASVDLNNTTTTYSLQLPLFNELILKASTVRSDSTVSARINEVYDIASEKEDNEFVFELPSESESNIIRLRVLSSDHTQHTDYVINLKQSMLPPEVSVTAVTYDQTTIKWKSLSHGFFGGHSSTTADGIKLTVTYPASYGHVTLSGDEGEFPFSGTGNTRTFEIGDLEDGFHVFTLTFEDLITENFESGIYFEYLFFNGIGQPDWETDENPFLLRANGEYLEYSKQDNNFILTVPVEVDAVSIPIPSGYFEPDAFYALAPIEGSGPEEMNASEESDLPFFPTRVDYVFNTTTDQLARFEDNIWFLDLAPGVNEFKVAKRDIFGYFTHTYDLKITRTSEMYGSEHASVSYKSNPAASPMETQWMLGRISDHPAYYVHLPGTTDLTNVKMNFDFDPDRVAEYEVFSDKEGVTDSVYAGTVTGSVYAVKIPSDKLKIGVNPFHVNVNDKDGNEHTYQLTIIVGDDELPAIIGRTELLFYDMDVTEIDEDTFKIYTNNEGEDYFYLELDHDPEDVIVTRDGREVPYRYGRYRLEDLPWESSTELLVQVFDPYTHKRVDSYTVIVENYYNPNY